MSSTSDVFKAHLAKYLLGISCCILLIGCDLIPRGSEPSSNTHYTRIYVADQNTIYTLNKVSAGTQVENLYVQTSEGVQCPMGVLDTEHISWPSDNLVLQTEQDTYSKHDIQQMKDYLTAMYTNIATILTAHIVKPPATLRWVAGASECEGNFQVANIGERIIQIARVGVKLASMYQLNTYHYHLIDGCSILPSDHWQGTPCGGELLSGGFSCSVYHAFIHMDARRAQIGKEFTGIPFVGEAPCSELTLKPGESVDIKIYYDTSTYPDNVTYSVIPEFVLDTSEGPHAVLLPELATTLIFTNPDQYSCYKLEGEKFVKEEFLEGWCV